MYVSAFSQATRSSDASWVRSPAARLAVATLGVALASSGGVAVADTLADAITAAYQTNPALSAARAEQQVTDEAYVQARAGWRPTVAVQAAAGYFQVPESDPFFGTQLVNSNNGSVAVTLQQPIYTGGRTLDATRAAKAGVLAGRDQLRSTEATILGEVIDVYATVLFDTKVLGIRQDDVQAFVAQVKEARARFTDGDATKTDVAQSEAQLAFSRLELAQSAAQLQADRVLYTTLVGSAPGTLQDVNPLPGLPANVDTAFDEAEANNPDLARAKQTDEASSARVAQARAARRPYVALQATAGYTGLLVPLAPSSYLTSASVQVAITQPIYDAGLTNSQIHQALAQETADRISIETTRRNVIEAVAQSWNAWLTARSDTGTALAGETAAETALLGSRVEYRSGLRSTTDVLLAEQALSNARLAVAQAARDQTVAEAAVLTAIGELHASALVEGLQDYDPAKSFRARERATSFPLENVAEAVDHLGAPSPGRAESPPEPPAPPPSPTMRPASDATPGSALITAWPTSAMQR
jgi:outer membrane protein